MVMEQVTFKLPRPVDADSMSQSLAVLIAEPWHAMPVHLHLAGLQQGLRRGKRGQPSHFAEPGFLAPGIKGSSSWIGSQEPILSGCIGPNVRGPSRSTCSSPLWQAAEALGMCCLAGERSLLQPTALQDNTHALQALSSCLCVKPKKTSKVNVTNTSDASSDSGTCLFQHCRLIDENHPDTPRHFTQPTMIQKLLHNPTCNS